MFIPMKFELEKFNTLIIIFIGVLQSHIFYSYNPSVVYITLTNISNNVQLFPVGLHCTIVDFNPEGCIFSFL